MSSDFECVRMRPSENEDEYEDCAYNGFSAWEPMNEAC